MQRELERKGKKEIEIEIDRRVKICRWKICLYSDHNQTNRQTNKKKSNVKEKHKGTGWKDEINFTYETGFYYFTQNIQNNVNVCLCVSGICTKLNGITRERESKFGKCGVNKRKTIVFNM